MATSDMYKSDGKENLLILNKTNSAAQYPGATVYADGAVYTSDSDKWNADTIKPYTTDTLPDPATLGAGETVVVEGTPQVVSNGELVALRNIRNTFAVVGDSFSARMLTDSTSNTTVWNNNSYLSHAFMMCKRKGTVVYNQSMSGAGWLLTQTPTFPTQIDGAIASGAGNLIVMGGFNDIYYDKPLADVISEAKKQIEKALLAGMRVFLCTQPTASSPYTRYSAARSGAMTALQSWYRQFVFKSNNPLLILVDCASVATDPVSATLSYKTGYVDTAGGDHIHPINLGSYYMGKVLADAIDRNLPTVEPLPFSNYDTYAYNPACTNVLTNGLFVDGSGGAATGWTTAVNAGATIGTKALTAKTGKGNYQVIPVTFTTDGARAEINSTGFTSFADGDEFYLEGEIEIENPVNVRGIDVLFHMGATTSKSWRGLCHTNVPSSPMPDVTTVYEFRSPVLKYNAATMGAITTGLKTTIGLTGCGVGSGTLKVSQFAIRKVVA